MRIHLATNCTEHFENCTENVTVVGFTQLYKLDYKVIQANKMAVCSAAVPLVVNLSVLATDIHFGVVDAEAIRRAKRDRLVSGARSAAECGATPFGADSTL